MNALTQDALGLATIATVGAAALGIRAAWHHIVKKR